MTTGLWEKQIREIEQGKYTKDLFIENLEKQIRGIIKEKNSKHE